MHKSVITMRRIMKERGISYDALSKDTGIDVSKLKRIMSGRQPMTLEIRDVICQSIGRHPIDVLLLAMEDHLRDISAVEIQKLIDELPCDTRRALVALIMVLRKNHELDT